MSYTRHMHDAASSIRTSPTSMFWGEMAPCDHFVQIYEDDTSFLDVLERFAVKGLRQNESVVIIATEPHRRSLERRLVMRGIDVSAARQNDSYIVLDAEETLSKFVDETGWPNDDKFESVITGVLDRAQANGRTVRAFGEMVAIMWGRGQVAATVRLEYLWNDLLKRKRFPLLCAYPKIGFTQSAVKSLQDVCDAHSRVFAA